MKRSADLRLGDCVEVMAAMDENSVDAIVTDPPYGLEFMGKEWDRLISRKPTDRDVAMTHPLDGRKLVQEYRGGETAQAWHLRWATESLRVLKPGGHLLAFGGTMGSGTTGVAAIHEQRRCIGIERDMAYLEIARLRVEESMPLYERE